MKKSFFVLLLFISCTNAKKITTGTYTVNTVKGHTVTLQGYTQRLIIASDTIKPGDKIAINIIENKTKNKRYAPVQF